MTLAMKFDAITMALLIREIPDALLHVVTEK